MQGTQFQFTHCVFCQMFFDRIACDFQIQNAGNILHFGFVLRLEWGKAACNRVCIANFERNAAIFLNERTMNLELSRMPIIRIQYVYLQHIRFHHIIDLFHHFDFTLNNLSCFQVPLLNAADAYGQSCTVFGIQIISGRPLQCIKGGWNNGSDALYLCGKTDAGIGIPDTFGQPDFFHENRITFLLPDIHLIRYGGIGGHNIAHFVGRSGNRQRYGIFLNFSGTDDCLNIYLPYQITKQHDKRENQKKQKKPWPMAHHFF